MALCVYVIHSNVVLTITLFFLLECFNDYFKEKGQLC